MRHTCPPTLAAGFETAERRHGTSAPHSALGKERIHSLPPSTLPTSSRICLHRLPTSLLRLSVNFIISNDLIDYLVADFYFQRTLFPFQIVSLSLSLLFAVANVVVGVFVFFFPSFWLK